MQYQTYSVSNGIQIIYANSDSPVSYCGFAVKAGARDEEENQYGLAHFVEHTLFKGTKKRKAWHILNRMEKVGGELNAYTTKEETFLYSVCLSEDSERAIELLSDLLFQSQFPQAELDKEKEVVIDEINSYRDNPSELIYDEFENILFDGTDLGHAILGDEQSIASFSSESCLDFTNKHYRSDNIIFFFYGKTPFKRIQILAEKYFGGYIIPSSKITNKEIISHSQTKIKDQIKDMDLHQTHVMIGCKAYGLHDKNRLGLYLLNNILGGPGMNSRLNLSLREKHGMVYTVDSSLTSYSDTGMLSIYFGCDKEHEQKCCQLVHKEIKKIRENILTTSQFSASIKQWKGQLGINTDLRENRALGMGKSFLHYRHYDSLEEMYHKIDSLTRSQLLDIANEIFAEENLHKLTFR
ncbi:insulinase family protein [Bacteroidales bacterium OttesenSCG-928-M11]|nr:insulinase family protein [Bacteroidales bacterium OttesenSCG-928-M11]